ncbi:uncharacterized protein [Dysidea avara]|uniref:uncharacterized protein isoform X2 n=1 Tax=Dysidea avara TaxID=196820 RepID=UPI003332ECE7
MGNKLKKPLSVDRSFNYECPICHVKPKVYCSQKGRCDWSKSDDKIICGLCKQPVRYSAIDKHRATECPCYYPTVRQDDSRKNKNTQIRMKGTHEGEKVHKKKFITKHTPDISCGAAAEGNSQEKKSKVAILFCIVQSETKNATREHIAPVIFEMHNFTVKMENETVWWSDPFFAFWRGYKMCLMVDVSRYGMSIYLYLMKGPYDDELEQSHHWPLRGTFKVVLLDQLNDDHYTQYISFDGISSNYTNRVMKQGRAPNGYGNFHFISHKTILDSNYLKNNSLYFMIFYQPNSALKQTANIPYEYVAPVTFKMYGFTTEMMKNEEEWESCPFFAFWRGHKMFLDVYVKDYDVCNVWVPFDSEDDDDDDVIIEIFDGDHIDDYCGRMCFHLHHIEGPYDDELKQSGHWPIRGTFEVEVIDQLNGNNHTHNISFDGIIKRGRNRNGIVSTVWDVEGSCQSIKHKGAVVDYDSFYFVISYQSNSA